MNKYEDLIGLKVISVDDFKTGDCEIIFNLDDGKKLSIECAGDCCSMSWFEHMDLPSLPFTINKIKEIEGKPYTDEWYKAGRSDGYSYDHIQTYGLKMETSSGYVDIDMRNDSNGYYGGYFEIELR